MLVGNGRRIRSNPITYSTALQQQFPNSGPVQKNLFYGSAGFDPLNGLPVVGVNSSYAQLLPLKAGGIASRSNDIDGSGDLSASGSQGVNLEATSTGTGTLLPPSMSLITSGSATISGVGDLPAAALVALLDAGANILSSSVGTGTLYGTGHIGGSIPGLGNVTLTPYATGSLGADITPFTDLSPQALASAVWNSSTAAYTDAGTMGKAMSDAGGAGNPWAAPVLGNTDSGSFGALLNDMQIELLTTSSDVASLEALVTALQLKIDELHQLEGLDPSHPMTVTPTSRTAGDITLAITGDGITTNTVTRE